MAGPLAWADGPTRSDPNTADALFRQGRDLFGAKKYDAACPKLEESYKLDPQGGTAFLLGECFEAVGRFASASTQYNAALEVAQRKGQADRVAKVKARLDAVAPKIPKLTVSVAPSLKTTAGLEVTRDATPLATASWDTPLPVDPGPHVVDATAPGKQKWEHTFDLAPGASGSILVDALTDEPAAATSGGGATAGPEPHGSFFRDNQRTIAYAAGGAGAVGVVVGSVMLANAFSKNDAINAAVAHGECAGACDSNVQSLVSDRTTDAAVGGVGLTAGGILLAGGVALWLTAPKNAPTEPKGAAMTPRITAVGILGSAGLDVAGTW
jgi:hypothetical protein